MTEHEKTEYYLERFLTDQMIEQASMDILCDLCKEMQQKFFDLALPEGTRPLWRLSWECEVGDSNA